MKNFSRILVIAMFLFSIGCATAAARKELVLKRASFDLDCSAEKLEAIELSTNTYGVSGCGKRGTYIVDCRGEANIGACAAILNSHQAPEKVLPPSHSSEPSLKIK